MHKARAGKMGDVIGEAKLWSKITPRLRTGEFAVEVWVDAQSRLTEIDGSGNFFSWSRRPISMNSVLEGFRHRRFDVIQAEIWITTRRR